MSIDLNEYEMLYQKELEQAAKNAATKLAYDAMGRQLAEEERVLEELRAKRMALRERLNQSLAGEKDPIPANPSKDKGGKDGIAMQIRAMFRETAEPLSLKEIYQRLDLPSTNKTVRSAIHRLVHADKVIKLVVRGVYKTIPKGDTM